MAVETLRGDGKAIEVEVGTGKTYKKGELRYADGFFGIVMNDGAEGETVAMEIAQRVHELTLPAAVTGAKGDVLYITEADDSIVAAAGAGVRQFGKVVSAKDSNDVAWVMLLPQA